MSKKNGSKSESKPTRSDPTEPRWDCGYGHSVPANASQCGICASLGR